MMNLVYVSLRVLPTAIIWGSMIWAIISYKKFLSGRLKDFIRWLVFSIFFIASLLTYQTYREFTTGQVNPFVSLMGVLAGIFLIISVFVLDELAETYGFGK